MFKPNFKYSNKIVKNLTTIAEARVVIQSSVLITKWEISLRREALLKSAHSSTAIEGNQLSLEEVSLLQQGREIMASRKDRQEVLNYLDALNKLNDFAAKNPFNIIDFLKIHKIVTKDTLDNPSDEGKLRDRRVYVGNIYTGEVIFEPPPVNQVSILVKDFLDWFNSAEIEEIDTVLFAGITHYEIVRIHPFIDGNGRTARVMAALIFSKKGFDTKKFFTLDDYYDQNRRSYYDALKNVNQDTLDLTEWLEYFSEGVATIIKAVKNKVIGLSKGVKILKDKGQIALSERQMKIVEYIISNNKITTGQIAKMFAISRQAALKEINKLIELEVVRLNGFRRDAHYVLY
ncbi:MAG: Fic family protein [Actinobacteria bacterium]|nr:Fic family protein [Actinomycetota bacterium]